MKKIISIMLVLVMVVSCLIMSGCSGKKAETAAESAEVTYTGDGKEKTEIMPGADGDIGIGGEIAEVAEGGAFPVERATADIGGNGSGGPDIEILPGTLTCGEWNDNLNYEFFRKVLERDDWKEWSGKWDILPEYRFRVSVSSGQTAAKNVICSLKEESSGENYGAAVTDASGEAYIYFRAGADGKMPDTLVVGDTGYPVDAAAIEAGGMTVNFEGGKRYDAVDIMFVVDTTGSMSDELDYLKKELADVVEKVAKDNGSLSIRVGLTFYRDEGDEYVVLPFGFDDDIASVCKNLDAQFSDGGGDFPEAVDMALEEALHGEKAGWREEAVRLVFFVLDAPPHDEAKDKIGKLMLDAATEGKRIIPVASSGIDTETEFILRSMAAVSGGTYVFLTDDSGVGGSHLEPTIGDYDVKMLNDMLVNIINGYCR